MFLGQFPLLISTRGGSTTKLPKEGRYYYPPSKVHDNSSWVTKSLSDSSRVKMQVSRLLAKKLSGLPVTPNSSDMSLPPNNARGLNPLGHVPPVSNESEACHVPVLVPVRDQPYLII